MTSSPNSIVLDCYDFESIDPSGSKDRIKTHEEHPDLLPIKNDNTSPLPRSNNPAIVKPTNSKEAVPNNDLSIEIPSTEVKYAFLRCLRKLVQTPGLVSWAKNEENDNIFTFSGVKNTEKAMTRAGFKTNRFDSLKRQMNAYGFKFIHACEEHDGAWYHPSNNFGLTGERDHAIIPRGKNRKPSSAVVDRGDYPTDGGGKRSSIAAHQECRKVSKRATKPPRRFSAKLGGGEHLDFSSEEDDAQDDFHVSKTITRSKKQNVPVNIRLGNSSFRTIPAVAIMPNEIHSIPIDSISQDPGVEAVSRREILADFREMEQLETSSMFQHAYDSCGLPMQLIPKTSHTGGLVSEYDSEIAPSQTNVNSDCNDRGDEAIVPGNVSFEESLDFILDSIHCDIVEEIRNEEIASGMQ